MHKQNLILLHGALGCKNDFAHLTNHIDDIYNVYSYEFEGHGARPITTSFSNR
jgi:esterase/lipase